MGYTIKIGHAAETAPLQFEVHGEHHEDAPTFPNDEMTGNTNERSPSYTAWRNFCRETGLEEMFYDVSEGLLRRHPGVVPLTQEHLASIKEARERWQAKATLPPGFDGWPMPRPDGTWGAPDEGKYDYQLARLLWLEWWVEWAIENAGRPAIENW